MGDSRSGSEDDTTKAVEALDSVDGSENYTILKKTVRSTKNGKTTIKYITEKVFADGRTEPLTEEVQQRDEQPEEDDKEWKEWKMKLQTFGMEGGKENGISDNEDSHHEGEAKARLRKQESKSESDSSSDEEEDENAKQFSRLERVSLKEHNRLRKLHGVPLLSLNKQMCEYATEWADYLANSNKFQHRSENKYGENIYTCWSSRPEKLNARAPIQSWYDEIKKHNFSTEPRSTGTGHFTQVVWKGSQELGIGVATKEGRTVVVANYYPPGNFVGKYVANVPPLLQDQ